MTQDFAPPYGVAEELAPGVRRLVASNPSPMTFRGTNTYLLGTGDIAVIDPGPEDADHLGALLRAVTPGQRISHIIVTHSHLDHSGLARPLAQVTGAPVLAFGDAHAGRSEVMQRLAARGLAASGEGVDHGFAPDVALSDGGIIAGDGWSLEALHTPGHLGNHLCLVFGDICFTADHVMGWASSLVSPPDGDLTDFMRSCDRLRVRDWKTFLPGHGAPIPNPSSRLDWLIAHRRGREAEILDVLKSGPADAEAIATRLYRDTPASLQPAARRNVLAHLIDLTERSMVRTYTRLSEAAVFERIVTDRE